MPNVPLQSALQAHGDHAARLLEITWVLVAGGTLVFLGVLLLLAAALRGPQRLRARLAGRGWVVGAGIVFPTVVLTALLAYTFAAAGGLVRAQREPATMRIEVAGEMWWWRVRYLDAGGAPLLETANELHVPVGVPVQLTLVSPTVVHSFWVPALAGKVDMLPGHVNRLRITAARPGVYRGQCAEFCGAQHANMAFEVVALAAPDFERWFAQRRAPAAAPADPALQRGFALFQENRCGVCHAVRGTPAAGRSGPDLTHVGSRRTLAAGTLPNGRGALAAWLVDNQHVKPGNGMPAYRHLEAQELQALAGWLESLQ